MKKILSVVLALIICVSAMSGVATAEVVNPFEDVAETAWYYDEIMKAVGTSIINGKSSTVFAPNDLLTYSEAIKLAACMNQVYMEGKVTLTNGTNGDPWYKPYVDFCREKRITTREYDPIENVTRAGYMEIFANALPEKAFEEINNIPNGSIIDVAMSATYAHYVYKLYRAGIVTGVDAKHTCNPESNIMRCEVATIISRMMSEGERIKFDIIPTPSTPPNADPSTPPGTDPSTPPSTDPSTPPSTDPGTPPSTDPGTPPSTDPSTIPLRITMQPEGTEAEKYDEVYTLTVAATGGKKPYTYQWKCSNDAGNYDDVADGGNVVGAQTEGLSIGLEKGGRLIGAQLCCVVTDAAGESVTSDPARVYCPFSMPISSQKWVLFNGEVRKEIEGQIEDGIVRKGDKVTLLNAAGKVVGIGIAKEMEKDGQSQEECRMGDSITMIYEREIDQGGEFSAVTVVKYQPWHSDWENWEIIVN